MTDRASRVGGRLIWYGEVVDDLAAGLPDGVGHPCTTVVLLHGWGLAHSSYGRAAKALAARGFRVLVPDLPGFGRSSELPLRDLSIDGFARSLGGFLAEVNARERDGGSEAEPVHIVGHSFGGAVAARLAYDMPELVASVVLVDAVGGLTWSRSDRGERQMVERPLWDWAMHLVAEFPTNHFPTAATVVLRDLRHNLIWHLPNLGLVARIARNSDLSAELRAVTRAGIPVSVVWAKDDKVVTRACFDDQCAATGDPGTVVPGNHGWPLADPTAFGEVIAESLQRHRR
jgi:pimeloyl-ACP methyl ester carboxylesterase